MENSGVSSTNQTQPEPKPRTAAAGKRPCDVMCYFRPLHFVTLFYANCLSSLFRVTANE